VHLSTMFVSTHGHATLAWGAFRAESWHKTWHGPSSARVLAEYTGFYGRSLETEPQRRQIPCSACVGLFSGHRLGATGRISETGLSWLLQHEIMPNQCGAAARGPNGTTISCLRTSTNSRMILLPTRVGRRNGAKLPLSPDAVEGKDSDWITISTTKMMQWRGACAWTIHRKHHGDPRREEAKAALYVCVSHFPPDRVWTNGHKFLPVCSLNEGLPLPKVDANSVTRSQPKVVGVVTRRGPAVAAAVTPEPRERSPSGSDHDHVREMSESARRIAKKHRATCQRREEA